MSDGIVIRHSLIFLCMFYVDLVCFYAEFFKIFDLLPVFLYALHNCLKSKIINSGYFK